MTGRAIEVTYNLYFGKLELDLSTVASGTYILSFYENGQTVSSEKITVK